MMKPVDQISTNRTGASCASGSRAAGVTELPRAGPIMFRLRSDVIPAQGVAGCGARAHAQACNTQARNARACRMRRSQKACTGDRRGPFAVREIIDLARPSSELRHSLARL